jgi:hypothetical protein
MKLFFYDIVPTNAIRFYHDYIDEFSKLDNVSDITFAVEHADSADINDLYEHYNKYFPRISINVLYVQFRNTSWFVNFFNQNNFDYVFFNGQRIADDRVVLACKSCGIKSFMIQHGMYIPFMKRDLKFFITKFKKSFSYLFYAYDIGCELNAPLKVIYYYLLSYVFGFNQVKLGFNRKLLNVDKVFVYGAYWIEFHTKQFGYEPNSQCIIGTPDLKDLSVLIDQKQSFSICYITQTLVEDGRLSVVLHSRFYKALVDFCSSHNLKLIVKLHPRGDISLYNYSLSSSNIEFVKTGLPHCKYYVGHYSSLLAKPLSLKNSKTILFEFPNHPIPHYFGKSALVIKNISKLVEVFDIKQNPSDISPFFEYNKNFAKKLVEHVLK